MIEFRIQNTEHRAQNTEKKSEIRNQKSEIRKAVKDMEALFAYQLIKVMRETTNSLSNDKGFGNSVYTSLFDMEIARLFAEKGLGLQEALMRWAERTKGETVNNYDTPPASELKFFDKVPIRK